MIKKINIYNIGRQTGKTNILKLAMLEAGTDYYSKVIYSIPFIVEITDISAYFKSLWVNSSITDLKYNQLNFIKTDLLIANLKRRGYKNVLLLLDEPFENNLQVQNELLHFLEESRTNFHILSYGTLNKNFKKFEDYIK